MGRCLILPIILRHLQPFFCNHKMLSFIVVEDYDYSDLTHKYMGGFNSLEFFQFLNTTQTGLAHSSSGTELSLLVKTIITSLTLCIIQLTMFSILRNIFKSLYQPRCYCVPSNEKVAPLPKGFLNWVVPTISYPIQNYLSLGLDTYFFIRYVHMLLLFFVCIGSINMIVLLPVNFTGNNHQNVATGLDKLSISNIAPSRVYSLVAHCTMGIITIALFHWLLIYEMETVNKIRNNYLKSKKHKSMASSRTLLIQNLPYELLDRDKIIQGFSGLPGGVKNMWFVSDYRSINKHVERINQAVDVLESAEVLYIIKYNKKVTDNRFRHYTDMNSLKPKFYPPVNVYVQVPFSNVEVKFKIWGWTRIFLWQEKVDTINWKVKEIQNSMKVIVSEKLSMTNGTTKHFNSIFIEFATQQGAYIAHQVLLSPHQGYMDKTVAEVHPRDILWENVIKDNKSMFLVQRYLVTILFICLIILYVVPVSFIGLISQIPLLVQLMPFLKWIYHLPEEARDMIASVLPSLLLSILSEIMMKLFRFLSYFKGKLTGSELEMDLQRWHFGFLFIQQFLVVTISSSITVIFKQIVDQPTSIPVMLATNLPKAAIFFFQFIAVKALGFCGNNFLRIDQLVLRNTFYRWWDNTPRKKLRRLTSLQKIKWGAIYPVYSVYASIGIIYVIISPLITFFIIFILSLVLLYYKYSLRFIYSHVNESETYGKLYPSALLHMYAGIYCLECCLIGIFFLLKDNNNDFPLRVYGYFMCLILIATIFGNITIYNKYIKHSRYLAIIDLSDDTTESPTISKDLKANYSMLYLHPSFKYDVPSIWLPLDRLGLAEEEIQNLRHQGLEGITFTGATIHFSFSNRVLELLVTDAPPDFKM